MIFYLVVFVMGVYIEQEYKLPRIKNLFEKQNVEEKPKSHLSNLIKFLTG